MFTTADERVGIDEFYFQSIQLLLLKIKHMFEYKLMKLPLRLLFLQ